MTKLHAFSDDILILAALSVVVYIAATLFVRRLKQEFNSIKWIKANPRKVGLLGIMQIYLFSPAFEELIFRVPLVILFSRTSDPNAWVSILFSAIPFGLIHIKNPLSGLATNRVLESTFRETDNLALEVKIEKEKVLKEFGLKIWILRLSSSLQTSFLGALAGYFAVKYQSIWLAVGIHLLWNILISAVVSIITMILYVFWVMILWLYAEIRFRLIRTRYI